MTVAVVLALLHVGLAAWFASVTPYRQSGTIFSSRHAPVSDIGAPDERQHVNYVLRLLSGDGFPIFDPKDPNLVENYQSHQPPAFYVIEAGWSKLVGVQDVAAPDAGMRLRLLNCIIGGITVLGVFFLAWWGLKDLGIACCSAAVAACLPMNVALSGSVSNDPLLFLLCTWTLAFCACSIRTGWRPGNTVAIGALTGLALLTKTTALALLPALLVAALLSPRRPGFRLWLVALLPLLLFPAGWWLRNERLYGDPFAMRAFNEAFVNSPQARTFIDAVGLPTYLLSWVGWWTLRSFIGAFGYMDIWLNETSLPVGSAPNALYRILLGFCVLLVVGWAAYWRGNRTREVNAFQLMNLCFGLVVMLLFLSFNLHYFQAQARYLYPAVGPICCAFGAGAVQFSRNRWPIALAALLLVWGGTTAYAGVQLAPEFQKRIAG